MSFDWKGLVGTVAPAIAGTFGTPLAGMGVAALCQALGLTPKATEAENHDMIAAKLAGATPADMLAIKNAEQQFIKDMKSLDIDLEKIHAGDRDSARKMQMETKSYTPHVLAGIITVGFFGILIGLLAGWLHTKDSPELLLLMGSLSTAWGMVVSFFYGSSTGSQAKDATIKAMAH